MKRKEWYERELGHLQTRDWVSSMCMGRKAYINVIREQGIPK